MNLIARKAEISSEEREMIMNAEEQMIEEETIGKTEDHQCEEDNGDGAETRVAEVRPAERCGQAAEEVAEAGATHRGLMRTGGGTASVRGDTTLGRLPRGCAGTGRTEVAGAMGCTTAPSRSAMGPRGPTTGAAGRTAGWRSAMGPLVTEAGREGLAAGMTWTPSTRLSRP